MSRYSTAWIARRLKRARGFEVQKMLNMRKIEHYTHSEKDERELKLLRALRRVCVGSMASEIADQSRFMVLYDTITRQDLKDFAVGQEKAKQLILKSKLFVRVLKILHSYHMAADCKPTSGLSETSFSTKQTAKNSSSNIMGGNRKKSQSNSKRTRVRDHRVRPSSSTALRLDKPSSLNSVFVSSLSSKGVSKAPKKKLIKNRLGQRARRQLAEKTYGAAAKNFKKGNRSQSGNNKLTKRVGHQHKNSAQANPAHKTTPTEQLHPSWAASKKKKELNKLLEPQGKRTVFADSD